MRPPRCPLYGGPVASAYILQLACAYRNPPPRPLPRYAAPSRSRRGLYVLPLRQDPNPHPLPRYAAPSRSRRGLEMYLGCLCRLQPFPRPFPRPRAWSVAPLTLWRKGGNRPDCSVCPLPLPAGASNHIILTEKCLSSVRRPPTSCGRFFFLCAGVRRVPWLLRRQGPRRASAQRLAGCAYHAII